MSYLLETKSEFEALLRLWDLIITNGVSNGNYIEVLNCLLSIEYDSASLQRFIDFKDSYLQTVGEAGASGWNRATRVYTNPKDRPTKPSYLKRLIDYPDRPRKWEASEQGVNQKENIIAEMAEKPGYSNLSFVFLRPADLIDKFRPGYVPCPIAGDFKFRDGRLNLSVMFRTCDAFLVGYADIVYLRTLQKEILSKAKDRTKRDALRQGTLGNLNLFFSRVYIPKSITQKDKESKKSRRLKVLPILNHLRDEMNI